MTQLKTMKPPAAATGAPPAVALIMTHGWPGSVIELLETVGPLTDPTSHGGTAGDATWVPWSRT